MIYLERNLCIIICRYELSELSCAKDTSARESFKAEHCSIQPNKSSCFIVYKLDTSVLILLCFLKCLGFRELMIVDIFEDKYFFLQVLFLVPCHMAWSRVAPNVNLTGKWTFVCVVYLLTRDSLVLWASMSLPESQYNLLRSLKADIFTDNFYSSPPACRMRYSHLWKDQSNQWGILRRFM